MWYEVPDDTLKIAFDACPPPNWFPEDSDKPILSVRTLVAEPNGKWVRRDDGVTAPVWEVRKDGNW